MASWSAKAPAAALLAFRLMEQIGLFVIGFFYLAISVGAIYGLFTRRNQLPRRRYRD